MIKQLQQATRFVRENDFATIRSHVLSHNAPPLVQFIKYGLCGVGAVILHSIVVYLLGLTINPVFSEEIPLDLKQSRTIVNNSAAFFLSGIFAYWTNVKFVFRPGRHGKGKEIMLFFAISAVSFFAGLLVIPVIFKHIESKQAVAHFANIGFIITSAMVNFVCRKFIIFKG